MAVRESFEECWFYRRFAYTMGARKVSALATNFQTFWGKMVGKLVTKTFLPVKV
jgi:hypothetical protein